MKKIYIEGENNPVLRAAFSKLLEQEFKGKMPRIVLGNGISQTIDKFRTFPLEDGEERYLLIDSDEPLIDKLQLISKVNEEKCNGKNAIVDADAKNTFFMVQEVEAWILSQPAALNKCGIVKGLPVSNIEQIKKPSEKLYAIYELNGKTYHKIKELSKVFMHLDSKQLKTTCQEYRALIEAISK